MTTLLAVLLAAALVLLAYQVYSRQDYRDAWDREQRQKIAAESEAKARLIAEAATARWEAESATREAARARQVADAEAARARDAADAEAARARASNDAEATRARRASEEMTRWHAEAESTRIRNQESWEFIQRAQVVADAEDRAAVRLDDWKAENEADIRRDAIAKSISVVRGKTTEHFLPYIGAFPYDPRDCRHMGAPIDMLVFDGLYGDGLREVVFLEIKTGKSSLSPRERSLRDAIKAGRVRWEMIRLEAK